MCDLRDFKFPNSHFSSTYFLNFNISDCLGLQLFPRLVDLGSRYWLPSHFTILVKRFGKPSKNT